MIFYDITSSNQPHQGVGGGLAFIVRQPTALGLRYGKNLF
jgi:hypothetical protein